VLLLGQEGMAIMEGPGEALIIIMEILVELREQGEQVPIIVAIVLHFRAAEGGLVELLAL
jgi:hypothetical protein